MGLGKSLFYHPLLLQHVWLASLLDWQCRGKTEDKGLFSAFSCFCKPSKHLHFLKYRWGIVCFFKLLMLLLLPQQANSECNSRRQKWKEQPERDCGRVSLRGWQKEAQLKAEQLPDLEQKMREKGVVVSETKHTWSQTGTCDSCTDDGFCGAVLHIQGWQTDAGRGFWALWTMEIHPLAT